MSSERLGVKRVLKGTGKFRLEKKDEWVWSEENTFISSSSPKTERRKGLEERRKTWCTVLTTFFSRMVVGSCEEGR